MSSVDHVLAELAARVDDAAPMLVETVVARRRDDVPSGAAADSGVRAAAASLLQAICSGLANGRRAPAHPPPGAVDQVTVAVAEGIAWTAVAPTYAVAHAVVWEHVIDEVEHSELDAPDRSAVLQLVSRYLFVLVDAVTRQLGDIYAAEQERLLHGGEQRRARLVADLLAGVPVAEEQLGYGLRGEHLGVIAWGPDRALAVAELARIGGLRALTVAGPAGTLWAWLGGRPAIDARVARALRDWTPPTGSQVALGATGAGAEGFRATHRQAAEAQRVALHSRSASTSYEDVALESLMLQDAQLARAFALRELGSLADADARSAVLRETLRAYFATGQNAAAAGATLGVHERTVGNRLQSIADRLGRPIGARRDELVVALRVHAVLTPEPVLRAVVPAAA